MTVSLGRLPTVHQRHGIKFCRFVQILQHRIQLLVNQDMKLTDSQNDPRRVTNKETITLDNRDYTESRRWMSQPQDAHSNVHLLRYKDLRLLYNLHNHPRIATNKSFSQMLTLYCYLRNKRPKFLPWWSPEGRFVLIQESQMHQASQGRANLTSPFEEQVQV